MTKGRICTRQWWRCSSIQRGRQPLLNHNQFHQGPGAPGCIDSNLMSHSNGQFNRLELDLSPCTRPWQLQPSAFVQGQARGGARASPPPTASPGRGWWTLLRRGHWWRRCKYEELEIWENTLGHQKLQRPVGLNFSWWSSMSWWKGLRRRWEWRKMGQRHADLPAMRQDSLWQRGKKSNSLLLQLGLLHQRPNFFLHLVYFIFTQPAFSCIQSDFLFNLDLYVASVD